VCCIVLQCVAAATGPFLTPPLVTGTNSPTNFTARVALCYTAHALICTHALAHTRSYTFACSHSLAGTRLHAFARRHSLAHPCMLTPPCMLHVDTFSNTRVVLRMDTHTHTHTHTHTRTCTHTFAHTHTHTRSHARAHARTHAHTHPFRREEEEAAVVLLLKHVASDYYYCTIATSGTCCHYIHTSGDTNPRP